MHCSSPRPEASTALPFSPLQVHDGRHKKESDIILNRANVALARSQRLVASWLPEPSADELANAKSEEELQREEDEIFTAVPETFRRLGVGAPLPEKAADGSWNRTELSSNDQLRKQLLGRNYDKIMKAKAAAKSTQTTAAQPGKPASTLVNSHDDDGDDDEDEGRTSMVGQKKRKTKQTQPQPTTPTDQSDNAENGAAPSEVHAKPAPSKGRKKATSYLDELLAERSKKRKKR
ncbi:hypothetical protein N7462_006316 [Penicillium macrosclerotiorum]|uniref:uncharacterized protein n=1 Tax=Penicillium macrosclerotiorum TaxID=303699 RepID=UPI002549A924|nr:uncharacterized protein N7462_006316 [Penicillium macrosclerotiorum]KAJ5683151.1 hypothetical protein N7462_006316 [Penicillium macrosclerotiorum]